MTNRAVRFLLAKLHLNSLMDKVSIKDIEDTLKSLPRDSNAYDQTYWETMNNIRRQKTGLQKLAMRALSWICCSRRTLKIAELQHALAVKESHQDFDEMNITEVGLILSVCKGLVTVRAKRRTIRLVHYTTQQYFERTWEQWFPEAHRNIAETLIRYLSFDAFNTGACQTSQKFKERLERYPLYVYATENWAYHARNTSIEEDPILMKFLEDENCLASSVQAIFGYMLLVLSGYKPKGMTGLHVAAYFGLERTVRLLRLKSEPNIKDQFGRTPIFWASINGYEAVVNALLENDAVDPECEDDDGRTPLFFASRHGHAKIVDCLLQHRADLHHMDENGRTPLSEAFRKAYNAVAEEFLNHHANVNYPIRQGDTPLRDLWGMRAAIMEPFPDGASLISSIMMAEYLNIMALRQDKNATVDLAYLNATYKNDRADTPLAKAAKTYMAVLDLFMKHGIDGMDPTSKRDTLLFFGTSVHKVMISVLLGQRKVNRNHTNTFQAALSLAALKGHKLALQLFLKDDRAHPNHRDVYGRTPIFLAVFGGNNMAVRILLETNRVDPNVRDSFGQTPLLVAARNGDSWMVGQLLENSAVDPNSRDLRTKETALAHAARLGYGSVVQLLLATRHVIPDLRDIEGRTPLLSAAYYGKADVVNLFLQDDRVNPNNKDKFGRTPLSWACGHGHRSVIEHLLCVETVDADLPDNKGRTPLFWAAWKGHPTVISYLFSMRKVNIECRDSNGQTPLSKAAESGSLAVVELLLSHGADVNAEDKNNITPLMKAVENGHEEVAQMLLAAGIYTLVTDRKCRSPFIETVKTGQPKVFQVSLNDAGLEPDASGSYGVTPLELAQECGRDDIVELTQAARQRGSISAGQIECPPRLSVCPRRMFLSAYSTLSLDRNRTKDCKLSVIHDLTLETEMESF